MQADKERLEIKTMNGRSAHQEKASAMVAMEFISMDEDEDDSWVGDCIEAIRVPDADAWTCV